jgi:hypothetical protein
MYTNLYAFLYSSNINIYKKKKRTRKKKEKRRKSKTVLSNLKKCT